MKYNIITGEDFLRSGEVRGDESVYSWIRGRSLESLVMHSCWLE